MNLSLKCALEVPDPTISRVRSKTTSVIIFIIFTHLHENLNQQKLAQSKLERRVRTTQAQQRKPPKEIRLTAILLLARLAAALADLPAGGNVNCVCDCVCTVVFFDFEPGLSFVAVDAFRVVVAFLVVVG